MLFKKLFRTLVLGGAVAGISSGCAAQAQPKDEKKPEARDAGAPAPDAGTAKKAEGGGTEGW